MLMTKGVSSAIRRNVARNVVIILRAKQETENDNITVKHNVR